MRRDEKIVGVRRAIVGDISWLPVHHKSTSREEGWDNPPWQIFQNFSFCFALVRCRVGCWNYELSTRQNRQNPAVKSGPLPQEVPLQPFSLLLFYQLLTSAWLSAPEAQEGEESPAGNETEAAGATTASDSLQMMPEVSKSTPAFPAVNGNSPNNRTRLPSKGFYFLLRKSKAWARSFSMIIWQHFYKIARQSPDSMSHLIT